MIYTINKKKRKKNSEIQLFLIEKCNFSSTNIEYARVVLETGWKRIAREGVSSIHIS